MCVVPVTWKRAGEWGGAPFRGPSSIFHTCDIASFIILQMSAMSHRNNLVGPNIVYHPKLYNNWYFWRYFWLPEHAALKGRALRRVEVLKIYKFREMEYAARLKWTRWVDLSRDWCFNWRSAIAKCIADRQRVVPLAKLRGTIGKSSATIRGANVNIKTRNVPKVSPRNVRSMF